MTKHDILLQKLMGLRILVEEKWGLRVNERGRLGAVIRDMGYVSDYLHGRNLENIPNDVKHTTLTPEFRLKNTKRLWMLVDAHQFGVIYDWLKDSQSRNAVSKLRLKIALNKGALWQADEDPHANSNAGRNAAFEIYIAAMMSLAGFTSVQMPDHNNEKQVDIEAFHTGIRWLVECKRPTTKKNIDACLVDAWYQLNSVMSKTALYAMPIICLDLTMILTKGAKMVLNPNCMDAARKEMGQFIQDAVDKDIEQIMQGRRCDHPKLFEQTIIIGAGIIPFAIFPNRKSSGCNLWITAISENATQEVAENRKRIQMMLDKEIMRDQKIHEAKTINAITMPSDNDDPTREPMITVALR